jgi:ADP-ribosylglycohydrolase
MDRGERLERALVALEGLSVGDAFGQQIMNLPPAIALSVLERRVLRRPPWPFTDDTYMALSIVSILRAHGRIEPDALARSFADRYEPHHGYGESMHTLLQSLREGEPWQTATAAMFGGQGSYGNGAAMRVAPLGAYFAGDLDACAEQAALSARVTHAHPEASAGAVAVATAAAVAAQSAVDGDRLSRAALIDRVLPYVPDSAVRAGLVRARDLPAGTTAAQAAAILGSGEGVSAQDTVPFTLWCAGESPDDYERAIWLTAAGLGDMDTTCAIVGGIVALSAGIERIPAEWRARRAPLPGWFLQDGG